MRIFMKKYNRLTQYGSISINNSYEGIPLESKISNIITSNEPIDSTSPIIFTERKMGVLPQYDPRTDRFDLAITAMDRVAKEKISKRETYLKVEKGGGETPANTSEAAGGQQ